jgi:hypothetical protein
MSDPSHISSDMPVNCEQLRDRLQKMTDNELRRFGRAARKKCSPTANRGEKPPEEVAIELEEAFAEWKRRFTQSPNLDYSLISVAKKERML